MFVPYWIRNWISIGWRWLLKFCGGGSAFSDSYGDYDIWVLLIGQGIVLELVNFSVVDNARCLAFGRIFENCLYQTLQKWAWRLKNKVLWISQLKWITNHKSNEFILRYLVLNGGIFLYWIFHLFFIILNFWWALTNYICFNICRKMKTYTREFLISLSELDVCKKLPSAFDQSILR